jgi:hypothetical protein
MLAHRDPKKRLCAHADTTEHYWAAIGIQVPIEDLELSHAEQKH